MPTRTLARPGETLSLGPVVVQNNAWGRGDLAPGRDFRQSVEITPHALTFAWDWPPPDPAAGVRAFPEVFAGRKPWGPETGGTLLPLPLAEAETLSLRFAFTAQGDPAGFTPALDLWIADAPGAGPAGIRAEVMLWLVPGPRRPAGRPAGRADLGEGLGAATLWVKPAHGAGGWAYAALVLDRPAPAATLDLGALLAPVRAAGLLPPDGWLLTVELGAEVTGGAGRLIVHDFALLPGAAPEARLGLPDPAPPPFAFID